VVRARLFGARSLARSDVDAPSWANALTLTGDCSDHVELTEALPGVALIVSPAPHSQIPSFVLTIDSKSGLVSSESEVLFGGMLGF
jgi:hypothetical protein